MLNEPTTHALFEAAREAMGFAHAPYSKFPVGAAIRAEDGKVYKGANIENLSFPQGWCAEPSAISAMVMGGARADQGDRGHRRKAGALPPLRRLPPEDCRVRKR